MHFLEQYRRSCNLQVVCLAVVLVRREHLSALKSRNVPGEKVYAEAPITTFAYCSIAGDVSIVLNHAMYRYSLIMQMHIYTHVLLHNYYGCIFLNPLDCTWYINMYSY